MTTIETVQKLTNEAKVNPVWNAVAHVFALRERARSQVTVTALEQRMKDEGFEFGREDYENVLKLLASVGVGKLVRDTKGRINALVDIKVTLQSIGKVAAGAATEVMGFQRKRRFGKLAGARRRAKRKGGPLTMLRQPAPKLEDRRPGREPRPYQTPGARVVLTVIIGEKPVNIPIPAELTADEIAKLIGSFTEKNNA
jgi:hypothetical protein